MNGGYLISEDFQKRMAWVKNNKVEYEQWLRRQHTWYYFWWRLWLRISSQVDEPWNTIKCR